MNVERIVVDKKQARELYREYKAHKSYGEKIDKEIQRTYQLIAQGRTIIKALESITTAGLKPSGYPKLAIANATVKTCHLEMWQNGSAVMQAQRWRCPPTQRIAFRDGAFPVRQEHLSDAVAVVPLIPLHLRPKEAIAKYHILWEAEWRLVPPRDPMLLRRIGGDLWLVVAAWDLTEVERAAMATRLSS